MSDIRIETRGHAGRITLTRTKALNAVTLEMVHAIRAALPAFDADPDVALVIIDAEGEKAFSAGGDIQDIYAGLVAGDAEVARDFWRAEYPMNAAIAAFPKPVVSLMQGFTMGGGVGVGCHASHRVVGESSRIAMPECGIGLVPDVGGSLLLAQGPGRLGEYLGTTASRMNAADAILAGFADHFVPEAAWPDLIAELEASGEIAAVTRASTDPGPSDLAKNRESIDAHFSGDTMADILTSLSKAADDWSDATLKAISRNAPLAMAATLELVRAARGDPSLPDALSREYRFAHRIAAQGDFQEGIRAAVIDKDRAPKWAHHGPDAVQEEEVRAMLAPLGPDEIKLED